MSDTPTEDLLDTVADLKARVEALERELAAMKDASRPADYAELPPYPTERVRRAELAGKWDTGSYSEEDFRAP